jgi:hypothetical protein
MARARVCVEGARPRRFVGDRGGVLVLRRRGRGRAPLTIRRRSGSWSDPAAVIFGQRAAVPIRQGPTPSRRRRAIVPGRIVAKHGTFERIGEGPRAREAVAGFARERLLKERIHLWREARRQDRRWRELGPIDRHEQGTDGVAAEGQAAGHTLVGHHRERPEIGLEIDVLQPNRLLRAHEVRRAHHRARRGHPQHIVGHLLFGDTEVKNLDEPLPVWLEQEQVVRFDVSVNDACGVRFREAPTGLRDDVDDLGQRQHVA